MRLHKAYLLDAIHGVSEVNGIMFCLTHYTGKRGIRESREDFYGQAIQNFNIDVVVSLKDFCGCYRFFEGEL